MNFFLILLLILGLFYTPQLPAQEVQYGNLFSLISQIKDTMPGSNSFDFVVPTTQQQDSFAVLIDSILSENYSAADSLAAAQGYKLLEWYDTAFQDRRYYVVMEQNGNQTGGVEYGWGSYLFFPEGKDQLIIEIPHPLHDVNTWRVGFHIFQRLGFKFLLMAGTHRYANGSNPAPADVAHNTQNMFHTVHQRVSPHSQYSFQVHGFSRSDYPDIVLSNGTASPYQVIDTLATELRFAGFSVGVYDGINYTAYGATTNTQGQWSRANGHSFIHMELEAFIRNTESEWENVIDAIQQTFIIIPATLPAPQIHNPGQIYLYTNYPNPFNPTTNVRFYLPKRNFIQLHLFNLSGQLVRQLFCGLLPAGDHVFRWDGRDDKNKLLSSGIYYLTVDTDGQRLHQKIHFLK